jgi:hypothetical protein
MEMEERMVSALKSFVNDRSEEVETKLLTEFHNHKWASPLEARQRSHTAALRAVDMEVEALDDRVRKLEGKPPE